MANPLVGQSTQAACTTCPKNAVTNGTAATLRRCRDFGENSGCIGGVGDGEGPCKPGLAVR